MFPRREYAYDFAGNRIAKIGEISTTYYLVDTNGALSQVLCRKGGDFMGYNGEGRCACCGTLAQRFKGPDGKLYCWDCYKKIWGEYPKP